MSLPVKESFPALARADRPVRGASVNRKAGQHDDTEKAERHAREWGASGRAGKIGQLF